MVALPHPHKTLTCVDAFSGGGILSCGLHDAANSMGVQPVHLANIEFWEPAAKVYKFNHPDSIHFSDVTVVAGGEIGSGFTKSEAEFRELVHKQGAKHGRKPNSLGMGVVDVLMGGPPCQGHSSLNNYTRHEDPKNALYLRMARLAHILMPSVVICENVVGVLKDSNNVVEQTKEALESMGYHVHGAVFKANELGVAQARKRYVLVACRSNFDLDAIIAKHMVNEPTVLDAIGDLQDLKSDLPEHKPIGITNLTQQRINWLFDNNAYDLPSQLRPECHRKLGDDNSYKTSYGRMHPDRPAPTITGQFGTSGSGRFIHPTRKRMLTPREALRIQGVPDWFGYPAEMPVRDVCQVIGNGAPPIFSAVVIASLFGDGVTVRGTGPRRRKTLPVVELAPIMVDGVHDIINDIIPSTHEIEIPQSTSLFANQKVSDMITDAHRKALTALLDEAKPTTRQVIKAILADPDSAAAMEEPHWRITNLIGQTLGVSRQDGDTLKAVLLRAGMTPTPAAADGGPEAVPAPAYPQPAVAPPKRPTGEFPAQQMPEEDASLRLSLATLIYALQRPEITAKKGPALTKWIQDGIRLIHGF